MTALSRRLSLPILAAGFACGLLMAPFDAAAASSPKACAAVARKAKAQLSQSLVACGRKGITAEIGRCGADQWTKYTSRLAERGCKAGADKRAKRIRHPMLTKIQAAFSADDLAAADIESREAHLALRRLLARVLRTAESVRRGRIESFSKLQQLAEDLEDAVARVDEAETTLAAVEDAIWHGFAGDPSLSWLIDEPLRVAMQQTQIEFRRLLGPEWPTEIAALRDDPGCQGDLIGDRMIATYGDAVLDGGKDRSAEAASLGRIAAQLACLSIRQTALVDVAVSVAADRVEQLLDEAGLARIRDAYARILAPIQVLVLDTVKIAGDHAYAWHWFVERHDRLRDAIARLGWATSDVVWLYDRIDGRMIGFPPCDDGELPGRCVDLGTFLDSLVDPHALGFGDCALSGMVAGGLRHGGGVDRYACPSTDCGAASSGKGTPTSGREPKPGGTSSGGISDFFGGGSGSSGGIPQGNLPWSGLTSNDLATMSSFGCSSGSSGGGGSGGDGGTQGPGGSLGDWGSEQECVEQALRAPRDPYVAYTRCVADVVGDERTRSLDFAGVPMGPDCRPGVADGSTTPPANGSTTTTAPPANATTTTVASTDPTTTTAPPSASTPCVPDGVLDAIAKIFECGLPVLEKALTSKTLRPSGEGGVVGIEVELLKPENGKTIIGSSGSVMNHKVDLACADGTLSEDMCAKLATMKPGEQAEYLRKTGHMDCADPEQCESACTTLDAQVMERMEDCQQELQNTLAPKPGGQNAPGTRINPAPDADTGGLPNDPLLSCLLAGADGSSGMDLGCALVSCAGLDAAAGTGSACCGAATPTIGVSIARIILEKTCQSVQCADGQAVVADGLGECGCGSGTPLTGGSPGPQPSPEGPRSPRN